MIFEYRCGGCGNVLTLQEFDFTAMGNRAQVTLRPCSACRDVHYALGKEDRFDGKRQMEIITKTRALQGTCASCTDGTGPICEDCFIEGY